MNIIDQLLEAPTDSATIAKFEGLRQMGRLSEKQIAYGESIIRKHAPQVSAETHALENKLAAMRRNTRKPARAKAAATQFEAGQTVTWSGKTGEIIEVQGEGRKALLIVSHNGETAKVIGRFAKVVA